MGECGEPEAVRRYGGFVAEPLADGTGVGLRRLGPGPARAGDPAVGDRRGDGRAVLPAVQVERHRTDRESAAGTDDFMRLAVAER